MAPCVLLCLCVEQYLGENNGAPHPRVPISRNALYVPLTILSGACTYEIAMPLAEVHVSRRSMRRVSSRLEGGHAHREEIMTSL